VVRWQTCDYEVARLNPAHGYCVPVTQRAIPPGSVNEYQRKLGVNGHTTRCISHGLAASAGVWLRAKEMEISATVWVHEVEEGLYFLHLSLALSLYELCTFVFCVRFL